MLYCFICCYILQYTWAGRCILFSTDAWLHFGRDTAPQKWIGKCHLQLTSSSACKREYTTHCFCHLHTRYRQIFSLFWHNIEDIQINNKNSFTNDGSSLVVLFQKVQMQLPPVHSGIMILRALTAKLWTGLKQSTVIYFKELIIFALVNQVL